LVYGKDNLDEISRFMEEQGSAWGMRRDVVQRGTDAIYEFVTNAGNLQLRSSKIDVTAQFDEFHLDLEIQYDGPPIDLTDRMPTVEELAAGAGVAALSHYLIRESADDVRVKKTGQSSILCLHFEH